MSILELPLIERIRGTDHKDECVVLLHGLARSKVSLFKLEFALSKHYHVFNKTYPSRKHTIEDLADIAIEAALPANAEQYSKIHFVTHSMGGILVRQYLSQHSLKNLGNVVMLGPPNQGSELVDYFKKSPGLSRLFQAVNGPAGMQLGTDDNSRPNELGDVAFNLGVIAGCKSNNPISSRILDGESDGKVSVRRSKVTGMTAHLVLPVNHTFMMLNEHVISQIEYFLEHSEFE